MITRRFFLSFFIGIICLKGIQVSAQILDDSTKMVYGVKTSPYQLLSDVKLASNRIRTVDTLLEGIENYQFNLIEGVNYQDLGLLFTAITPTFRWADHRPGTGIGQTTLDLYAFQPENVRYFDTRSPFSRVSYVQGGKQQNMLTTEFSRPILPNWNFTFLYRRSTAARQVAARSNRERQTDHHSLALNSHYISKDKSYKIYGGYYHLRHKMFETGGIRPGPNDTRDSLFDYKLERVRLADTAINIETRHQWHVYQEWRPGGKLFFLFHEFSRSRQLNSYDERNLRQNVGFYPLANVGRDSLGVPLATNSQFYHHYSLMENQLGIGLQLNEAWRLRAGLKLRSGGLRYRFEQKGPSFREQFVYAKLSRARENSQAEAIGELGSNGDFKLGAEFQTDRWLLEIQQSSVSPALFERFFDSDLIAWNNNFSKKNSSSVSAKGRFRWGRTSLIPGLRLQLLDNMIYFDTLSQIRQWDPTVSIWQAGVQAKTNLGNWQFHLYGQAAGSSTLQVLRIPSILTHARIFYANKVFKKTLSIETGVSLRWMSSYQGYQYMPATMQFYLQNSFDIQGYLLADVFLNFRVRSSTIFFKVCHANQGLMAERGYFVSPYYTGQQRAFEFGFNWLFFD